MNIYLSIYGFFNKPRIQKTYYIEYYSILLPARNESFFQKNNYLYSANIKKFRSILINCLKKLYEIIWNRDLAQEKFLIWILMKNELNK